MKINRETYLQIKQSLLPNQVLVAVSKLQPVEAIRELYNIGHRHFGENYVQELMAKQAALPADICWHFIGHLQSNKVKYIAPFVHLIQGVDSEKLLTEINKQAAKNNRSIACLLQVHIATEETKFGFDEAELLRFMETYSNSPQAYSHIKLAGLMGMASFSNDETLVRSEFRQLHQLFEQARQVLQKNNPAAAQNFANLSMGMSGDYQIALQEGSTMIRIGSLLFGARRPIQ